MKKRLLSALLALALVFVLLPTTALAEETTGKDYDISINGKGYKFDSDGSNGYITAYYYGNSPLNYFFSTKADEKWATNSNLKLTKEGNTVTITIRPRKAYPYESPNFTLKKESTEKNDVPCIEMGNDNNLVITGKGTLNITRNENKSYGAALYSNVGDITINGGITVNVSFLNGKDYNNKNVSSNAIYVGDNHNLTVSGSGTNVIATNQGFDSSPATVCVEGGTITVSGGASLSATNTYDDNRSGSDDVKIQHFNSYAISGTKSKPCTLIVADEKSSVTATTNDFTNIAESWAFKYTTIQAAGATIKAGSSASNSIVTTIDDISGKRYAKISIPALQRTSDVFIAGENAVVGVETSIPSANGSGTYFYDQASKTLTLKDVNIASSSIINGIQFTKDGTYTINLVGTNTMSGFSTGISANSADQYVSNINITITGAGSLEVSTTSYAIAMNKGNLKFENTGEIKLTTSNISKKYNVLSVSGNITIADMEKYKVEGIVQDNTKDGGDTVTLSEASHLKGYKNPDGTAICLKTITITPAAAKPSTISYDGTTLKQGETIYGETSGTATVAAKGNTITLDNFKGNYPLEFNAEFTPNSITLIGDSTLSAVETKYQNLTISGSGSLTVGSIKVTNNYNIHADLTITDGAKVTAGTTTSDAKAIDITGNLTVNSGATLTATNASETNPTIDVTGNVTISGDPGTNAYTVSAHNSYNVQKDRVGNLSPSGVPSAIKIGGTLNISAGARVMAQTDSYGAGVMLGQNSTITVEDAFLSAQNSSCDFAAISFSGYMGDINVSGAKGEIVAENTHTNIGTKLAFKAINAFVYNRNTDFYLKMQSEGVIDEEIIAPGEYDASGGKKVTITRGDEVTPVVIAGTPLLNDTYYTITNGSTVVANGSESNYNAFYDSANKTLKLNNAQISHSFAYEDGGGKDGAIIFTKFENYFIELSGENTISSTNTYAINCHRPDRTLTIKNAAEAENAKLTLTSNWMVICSIGGLNIQSDVTMVNTKRADYLMYVNGTFSYTGYNAYASTEASGSPLEVYNPENYSTYKYLRVTKENLAPTTPTTYTVTITAGDNMKRESGALTQEVTKGAAITEVKFMAASGHYFPADYVSKMNLPAGLTAEIRENSWYLIISGTPTSDVTINLPAASVRPTITVSMPTPVAGYTPATASDITLTYSDINKSISKNLTISNVVWQSYVSNGDGSITPGNTLSSGDKFEAGKTYFVRITHEYVAGKYDIVPAAGITLDYTESDSTDMMLLFYTTGAPCNHEYTNDWHANGNTHWHECKLCRAHADEVAHTFGDWITDTPATDTTDGSKHRTCSVCQYKENATIPKTGTGEIVPPTPDNPGTIVIIRPAEEEKPAQQPNPSTGANDLVGLAVAAAVAAALGSAALLRKHD